MSLSTLSRGRNGSFNSDCVRIVHISDTHMNPEFSSNIPLGDILVHSGDFLCHRRSSELVEHENYYEALKIINSFFASQPHNYKLYVAGNQETNFISHDAQETKLLLPNVHYLQDSGVMIEGLKFYGSPWVRQNSRYTAGFVGKPEELNDRWRAIPADADILITHQPPFGILDKSTLNISSGLTSWGCKHLYKHVTQRIRPRFHLFGHSHPSNGIVEIDGIVYSNAAMEEVGKPNVLDIPLTVEQQMLRQRQRSNRSQTCNTALLPTSGYLQLPAAHHRPPYI